MCACAIARHSQAVLTCWMIFFSLDNLKRNEVAEELPLNENVEENKILKTVEKILVFKRQKQGKGLKILTPNQMLSRLPISLAQLKAENNSEKLKNDIRQLMYSLYRSKRLTKNSI